jgi:hypothetical protein
MNWSPSEAAAVNEFLNSTVGKRWISLLQERKPPLDMTSIERTAITGSFASGYESFFKQIEATRRFESAENASAKQLDMVKD